MEYKTWSSLISTKTLARLLLGMLIFSGFFCCAAEPVQAFDAQNYKIESITIFKIYNSERQLEERRVLITGQYLKDAAVGMITSSGYEELKKRLNNSEGLLQFEIDQEQTGSFLVVEGVLIALHEGAMPALAGVDRRVRVGVDDLYLTGTNLDAVSQIPGITAGYEHEGAYTAVDKSYFNKPDRVCIPQPSGALGWQNLIFEKTETSSYERQPGVAQPVVITIKHTYQKQFRLVQDLLAEGLEMYPNRGQAGSKLIFQAPHKQLNTYDVFFLKHIDGTDPYTALNQGKNRTYQSNVNNMDILTVEVPNLPVGEYYVILTNPVAAGYDPMEQVFQELIVGSPMYQKFTVIDAEIQAVILGIQPSSGPDSGSPVTISGQYLGTLNIPEFLPEQSTILTPEPAVSCKELLLSYGPGTYRGTEVVQSQRRIKVIIGDQASFVPKNDNSGYDLSFDLDLDVIKVNTAPVADANTDPRKDVVVETETTLTRVDGKTIVFRERAELKSGYTYIPSKIAPQITAITPDKIQVVAKDGAWVLPEARLAAITGSNFAVTRFTTSQGEERVRYPIIELGADIILDKNTEPGLDLQVFDKSGREVDGTASNELGSRIRFVIPADASPGMLGKTYVKVTNPIKHSTVPGLSAQRNDFISFVNPEADRQPLISAVNPDVVTVEGGENIIIEGSNFMIGVKVFIDGCEVSPISRQEDGKRITLKAPACREGQTQLQVMNPEGAMDTAVFNYVLTYTNPRILGFSPKMGNTGTLVMVRGENFLKPEAVAAEVSPWKLIGTRILLEGQEINQYNRNSQSGQIELQDYSNAARPLMEIHNDSGQFRLELADYYRSVFFQDTTASGEIFTVDKSYDGNITLSNGASRTYQLEVSPEGVLNAVGADGKRVLCSLSAEGMEIFFSTPLRLALKTPYLVDGSNNIRGHRVKVLDSNTILFTVPILEADGYYDLTVVNPDTKRDSRLDQQGFYYFKMPLSQPTIAMLKPEQGSVQGGYSIDILGAQFEDNGITKSRVYINGIEVGLADTQVSTGGDTITVKVPPYPGDLRRDKGTDRFKVPVVIVNPDGASAGREDGFTYVVPASHPHITRLSSVRGSGAGGEVVEIIGSDFRYFEPYDDANRNQVRDPNEAYSDLNHNQRWDSEADLADPLTDWREPMEIQHSQYNHYYDSPILPQIYFGQEKAQIVEFSRGYIKVLTPPASAGSVKVYLLNNDAGISNTVNYSYESLNPVITSIIPGVGPKQGRQYTEIMGSGFAADSITILHRNSSETVTMPVLRFGETDNRSIPRDQPGAGRIDNGVARVELAGGLLVEYQASGTLRLKLQDRGQIFAGVFPYNDAPVYIPLDELLLQDDDSTPYQGYELCRVSVEERRLIVERGYAPQAELLSSRQMTAKTPSHYTIGVVPVRLYNPDGSQAQGRYEYMNPDSHPQIVNITRDGSEPSEISIEDHSYRILKMNHLSRPLISVLGQDFREAARIQVGDLFTIDPRDIRYELPGKLSFVMPEAPQQAIGRLFRVVVVNADGGTAASDQIPGEKSIYIQFTSGESSPKLTSITPTKGPAGGGTVINLSGSDFRYSIDGYDDTLEVYFGPSQIPAEDVSVVDYKTCRVITSPQSPGIIDVKVENPDGVQARMEKGYTFISEPHLTSLWDAAEGVAETPLTEISVLGGQKLKIKGEGFLPGAVVVFDPVLTATTASASGNTLYRTVNRLVEGVNSRESQPYYLQSGQVVAAEVLDGRTLLVTTPAGVLGSGGILVKNPDGGASNTAELTYSLPHLPRPDGVTAEIIHDHYADCDRYIKVHWAPVDGAISYETYVLDDNETKYIGTTQLTTFVYENIQPRHRYQFVVAAVGDFGSSPPSLKSNLVRTGPRAGIPDIDGAPGQSSSIVRSGAKVFYSMGTRDSSQPWSLDLTQGELAGTSEVEVAIPAALIRADDNSSLKIRGKDFEIIISPRVFNNQQFRASGQELDGVRLRIAPADISSGLMPANSLSCPYLLQAQAYKGSNRSNIDQLAGSFALFLSHDHLKAQLRQLKQISPCRLDVHAGTWVPLPGGSAAGWNQVNQLGTYCVIGNRG